MVGSEAKLGEDTEGVRLKACKAGKEKGTRFGLGREGEGMAELDKILERFMETGF